MEDLPEEIQTFIISYIPYATSRTVCSKWKSMIDDYKVKKSFYGLPEAVYFNMDILKKYILNCTDEKLGYFVRLDKFPDYFTKVTLSESSMIWFMHSASGRYNMNQWYQESERWYSNFDSSYETIPNKSILNHLGVYKDEEFSDYTFYPSQEFIEYLYKNHPLANSNVYLTNKLICHKSYYIAYMKENATYLDKNQIDEYETHWTI
jgi:hypothetical protein